MKADLESDRKVSKEEAEELCNAHNGKYFECSAKTGQNIHEALTELVRVARPEGALPFTVPGKRKGARSDDEHRCICM
jgi:translation elongation factor EF-4